MFVHSVYFFMVLRTYVAGVCVCVCVCVYVQPDMAEEEEEEDPDNEFFRKMKALMDQGFDESEEPTPSPTPPPSPSPVSGTLHRGIAYSHVVIQCPQK